MKSKKIVALIVAFAAFMAVATSGLAATTTTTYLGEKVSVRTEIAAETGKEVTYLVKSGNEIVYIDQQTAKDNKAVFDYKIAKNKIVDLTTDVQFGTNGTAFTTDALEGKALEFGGVTVNSDAGVADVTFHKDKDCDTAAVANTLGTEDEVYALVTLNAGYEIDTVKIGEEEQNKDGKYLVKKGDVLTIITKQSVVAPKVEADDMVIEDTVVPEGEEPIDTSKYAVKTVAMKITGAPQYVGVVVGDTLYRALPGVSGVYSADAVYAVRIITDKNDVIDNYELYVDEE